MRVTKQPKQEFNYLDTIQKINKMQGSPHYLSKENSITSKSPLPINLPKDSILNNIPIKVRLIHATKLNPNINMDKIHDINHTSKTLKKEIGIKKKFNTLKNRENKNLNDISTNLNLSKKEDNKINTESNEKKSNKKENYELTVGSIFNSNSGLNNNQNDINQIKDSLISSKNEGKDKEKESDEMLNINNIKNNKFNPDNPTESEENYEIGTYKKIENKTKNLFSQNFAYNKPKKGNILGCPNSLISHKVFMKTELNNGNGKIKESENKSYIISNCDNSNICSTNKKKLNLCQSPKITKIKMDKYKFFNNNDISNNINNNYNKIQINNKVKINQKESNNKVKINQKESNNAYGLNAYVEKDHNILIANRLNISPIRLRNNFNTNNNSFNLNNNYNYNINVLNLNSKKENINSYLNYANIEIKLDDLILFEERLTDISIALNNSKSIYEGGASNECVEFFVFYFHSSLKQIFPYYFNGMNKVIIKSAINLKLLSIVITYHLSMNPVFLNKLVDELKNIFSLCKMNLYLFIKKIQLFYGENYTKQNEMYFKTFNYILTKKGLFNINENEIVEIINQNCREIVKNLNNVLNFYKKIDNNYYLDFLEMFESISKITEKYINNYFYNHLYGNSSKGEPQPKYNNSSKKNIQFNDLGILSNFTQINITKNKNGGIIETSPNKNIYSLNHDDDQENMIILDYQKNKISSPFLKTPNEKKYTVVLDLDETLVNVNQNGICNLRPGLFSFLNSIKPYYEIISFTNGEKCYSDSIIQQIEARNKYFDYNLCREHSFLSGKEFLKDISRIGRDMKKIIIVDNISNNFKLNPENGIQISPYFGEYSKNDTVLFELKKLLIMFYKMEYEDLREALKKYAKEIKANITREASE